MAGVSEYPRANFARFSGIKGMIAKPSTTALIDAALLLRLVQAASDALFANRPTINALNVFPVPDGDTGTNMSLTLRSIVESEDVNASTQSASELASKMARASLLGARGNSGLLLAQLFKGIAQVADGNDSIAPSALGVALGRAYEFSQQSVPNPVEGTMITIYRECSEKASEREESSAFEVLEALRDDALDAVRRTPEMLDVLAEAEVVDSGGFGLAVMFDGMVRAITNTEPVAREIEVPMPSGRKFSGTVKSDFVAEAEEVDWGYCTVFAIEAENLDLDRIRDHMDRIGRSPIVDGAPGLAKVHVHMEDPGEALSAGIKYGSLSNIEISNMDTQAADWASDRREDIEHATTEKLDSPSIAVVAVAAGQGMADLIENTGLGAAYVIEGGDSMNPSVAELLEAVEKTPSDQVILLPNNKNIIAAAEQVDELTDKTVRVVPTRSVQTGVAALLAFNLNESLDENVEEMIDIAGEVGEGRVCKASRDVSIGGHEIKAGMTFATFDDEIIAVGRDTEFVLGKLITAKSIDAEIITVYTGNGSNAESIQRLSEELTEKFGDLEIEVVWGGQPHYDYLVAVE